MKNIVEESDKHTKNTLTWSQKKKKQLQAKLRRAFVRAKKEKHVES